MNIPLRCGEIEASDGNYGVGHMVRHLVHHSTLRALPACAERREPAMCVYESYMSHMGMKTQLDERPRSVPRRKQSRMTHT
jgi:hypothetical protein